MSNYPPGCVTYRGGGELELACPNERCPEFGILREVRSYWELGATFLVNEDEGFCPECSTEMPDYCDVQKHERTCLDIDDDGADEDGYPILRQITLHTEGCSVCEARKFVRIRTEKGREIEFTGSNSTERYIKTWTDRGAIVLASGYRDPWQVKA